LHFVMIRVAVCLGASIGLLIGCQYQAADRVPQAVRIATGDLSGTHYPLGTALARLWNDTVPGVHATAERTGASTFNVKMLDDRSADLALARADVVYRAYTQGTRLNPRPHTGLKAIAVMYASVLHVVTRSDSHIRTLADLRGARIGYGSPSPDVTPPVLYTDLINAGGVLAPGDMHAVRMNFDDVADAVAAGELESGFILSGYPVATLTELARNVGLRLLEIEPTTAVRMRAQYPFYKPAVIPAGTYPGQKDAITTVGVDNLMLCRDDLDEALVYGLTKAFFEGLPQLVELNEIARQVDPDLAPATPIPLHPGAARYYRERELLK
jgi:uncharacterized protein